MSSDASLLYTAPTRRPWAWLGRFCWLLAELLPSNFRGAGVTLLAFKHAFLLDPELAIAHQFYTPYQLDMGQIRDALIRPLTLPLGLQLAAENMPGPC